MSRIDESISNILKEVTKEDRLINRLLTLGIKTKDNNGDLRSMTDIVKDINKLGE